MKKWVVGICLCLLFVSVGLTFSACNSNTSAESVAVTSVVFEKPFVYAEYQERVELHYKVYPSNATPTNVNFSYQTEVGNITLNESLLSQGIVYINKPQNVENSGKIKITINVDGKTDDCTVQLKPYPSNLSLNIPEEQTLSVLRGQSIQLPLMVTNDYGTNTSPFEMYHFTFTTPNGISINKNGVLFCAENYPSSTATITATIKYHGRDDVVFEFEINVLPQKPQEVTLVHPTLGTLSTEKETSCALSVGETLALNVYAANRVAGGTQQVPYLNVKAYAVVAGNASNKNISITALPTENGATLTLTFQGVTGESGESLAFTLYVGVDGEKGPILQEYTFVINFQKSV